LHCLYRVVVGVGVAGLFIIFASHDGSSSICFQKKHFDNGNVSTVSFIVRCSMVAIWLSVFVLFCIVAVFFGRPVSSFCFSQWWLFFLFLFFFYSKMSK